MRHINDEGLAKIRQFEGLRTKAYKCPAGVWTIGYGHTSAAGAPAVTSGMVISTLAAEEILKKDLEKFEAAVTRMVKASLTDNQFAALVSFVYNVGEGAFAKSTLLKKLNAGQYAAVPSELAKWVKAGKKTLPGLVNRRAAEAGLWAKGAFVSSNTVEVVPDKPSVAKSPEAVSGYIAAGSGAVAALSGATGPMAYALAAGVLIAIAVGVWFFVQRVREGDA